MPRIPGDITCMFNAESFSRTEKGLKFYCEFEASEHPLVTPWFDAVEFLDPFMSYHNIVEKEAIMVMHKPYCFSAKVRNDKSEFPWEEDYLFCSASKGLTEDYLERLPLRSREVVKYY